MGRQLILVSALAIDWLFGISAISCCNEMLKMMMMMMNFAMSHSHTLHRVFTMCTCEPMYNNDTLMASFQHSLVS